MATRRDSDKVRNVHLGSCRKLSREKALQKARAMKAEAIGNPASSANPRWRKNDISLRFIINFMSWKCVFSAVTQLGILLIDNLHATSLKTLGRKVQWAHDLLR